MRESGKNITNEMCTEYKQNKQTNNNEYRKNKISIFQHKNLCMCESVCCTGNLNIKCHLKEQ